MTVRVAGVLGRELLDEVWSFGSRPDECHVAAKDVPELRELVDGGSPDDLADRSDSLVRPDVPLRRRLCRRRRLHRPELQTLESSTVTPDALLVEDDPRPALEPHCERARQEDRRPSRLRCQSARWSAAVSR